MKSKIKNIILLIVVITFLLLTKNMFEEYNLKRTVSACIVAQKQTSESFDPKKAKRMCEKIIQK